MSKPNPYADETFLDQATSQDEILRQLGREMQEQNSLTRELMAQQGITDIDTPALSTPFAYASVPSNGKRLALPHGETTIDFDSGKITNEYEGEIGTVTSLDELSEGISTDVQALRSFYVYADVVCQMKLDDSDWLALDSCQYMPLKSQGFTSVTIKCKLPFTIYGAASTRSQAIADSDSPAVHMDREGDVAEDQYDGWKAVPMKPSGVDDQYAKPPLHTISFGRNTWRVENTSSSANAIDARVMAADTHHKDFYEIASASGISKGDHHVFHVTQSHHLMMVQITNSATGNVVGAKVTMTGAT